ncbi:MAG: hypothetical protein IT187_00120, partial [Geothrix sp.]|nr:hypothetical protein [Geothrix sp.]
LAVAMIGGRATTWLHPATMAVVFVLVVPLVAALSAHPWEAFRRAFRDAFDPSASSPSNAASEKVWRHLESFIYFGGVIAFFAGLIVTFSFLGSDLRSLGIKFAATLVAPFYSVLLAMSCRVLRARVPDYRLSPDDAPATSSAARAR